MVFSFLKKLAIPIVIFLAGFFVSTFTVYDKAFVAGVIISGVWAAVVIIGNPKEDTGIE